MFAAGSERSSIAPAQPERAPPPLPPPRFPNSGVWQWETPLNIGNFMIMSTPIPLLMSTNSLTIENHLYEIITERSKACAAFLRNSLRRATNSTTNNRWNVQDNVVMSSTNNNNGQLRISFWKNPREKLEYKRGKKKNNKLKKNIYEFFHLSLLPQSVQTLKWKWYKEQIIH